MALEIVIANRLRDGRAVYRSASGWSRHLAEAQVAGSEAEAEALLALAKRSIAANEVVDPYLIDVVEEEGRLVPARRRERIRARGPTVAAGRDDPAKEVA
ncbi:MAG: DUF2849 domain-containing protein [Alphaproteobacteria bacterium]